MSGKSGGREASYGVRGAGAAAAGAVVAWAAGEDMPGMFAIAVVAWAFALVAGAPWAVAGFAAVVGAVVGRTAAVVAFACAVGCDAMATPPPVLVDALPHAVSAYPASAIVMTTVAKNMKVWNLRCSCIVVTPL
jgi:hypothetical protein